MQPVIFYCYDAYCGWCYGFSSVITKIKAEYKDQFSFEVLSGGMIPAENPSPIAATANYIKEAYPRVEELTGVMFGDEYLWHIRNSQESDWFPHSEKAAIALCIFKEIYPEQQVQFVADLQYALHYEGRDLTDDEAYRHLVEKYNMDAEDFYLKLQSEAYLDKAHYEFSLCKQLQVSSFPQVLMQISDSKFHLLASGYTDYENLSKRIDIVLKSMEQISDN